MFGKIHEMISGPERTFVVGSVERGQESTGRVQGSISAGWVSMGYSRKVPVILIYVELDVNGTKYEIDTSVPLEYYLIESFDGLSPRQLERLEQMIGRTVEMRAKEPYDSRTLEKLARS